MIFSLILQPPFMLAMEEMNILFQEVIKRSGWNSGIISKFNLGCQKRGGYHRITVRLRFNSTFKCSGLDTLVYISLLLADKI